MSSLRCDRFAFGQSSRCTVGSRGIGIVSFVARLSVRPTQGLIPHSTAPNLRHNWTLVPLRHRLRGERTAGVRPTSGFTSLAKGDGGLPITERGVRREQPPNYYP